MSQQMFSETEQTSAMMRDGIFFPPFLSAVEQRPGILTEFYANYLFPYIHANAAVHMFCLSIAVKN